MAFTRFNYDPCRTMKSQQQATGPGRYMFATPGMGVTLASWKIPPSVCKMGGESPQSSYGAPH